MSVIPLSITKSDEMKGYSMGNRMKQTDRKIFGSENFNSQKQALNSSTLLLKL